MNPEPEVYHYRTSEDIWLEISRAFRARATGHSLPADIRWIAFDGLCEALLRVMEKEHRVLLTETNSLHKWYVLNAQLKAYLKKHYRKVWDRGGTGYLNNDYGRDKMLRAEIAYRLSQEAAENGI